MSALFYALPYLLQQPDRFVSSLVKVRGEASNRHRASGSSFGDAQGEMVDPAGETSNQLFDTFANWENYLKQHRINVLELKP